MHIFISCAFGYCLAVYLSDIMDIFLYQKIFNCIFDFNGCIIFYCMEYINSIIYLTALLYNRFIYIIGDNHLDHFQFLSHPLMNYTQFLSQLYDFCLRINSQKKINAQSLYNSDFFTSSSALGFINIFNLWQSAIGKK